MACTFKNYNTKDHYSEMTAKIDDLTGILSVSQLVEKVKSIITSGEINIATTTEKSNKPNEFTRGILTLINDVTDYLYGKNGVDGEIKKLINSETNKKNVGTKREIKLSLEKKQEFKKQLRKALLPEQNLTTGEALSYFVIEGDNGIVTEEDRLMLSFNEARRSIEGDDTGTYDSVRDEKFGHDLLKVCFIDTEADIYGNEAVWPFPKNNRDICNKIIAYHESQYKILYDYLKKQKVNLEGISTTMYHAVNGKQSIISTWQNLLTLAINYIKKIKTLQADYSSYVETDYQEKKKNPNSTIINYYDFISAYLNLTYFDTLLKDTFKYISINQMMELPIQGGKLKYKINRGNDNSRTGWNTKEEHDALKEMSKFRKLLISTIELYDYKDHTSYGTRLEVTGVLEASALLKEISQKIQITQNDEKNKTASWYLREGLVGTEGVRTRLDYIFRALFEDTDATLLNNLKDWGITDQLLNIIYSLYRACYMPAISEKYIKSRLKNNSKLRELKAEKINAIYDALFSNLDNFDSSKITSLGLTTEQLQGVVEVYRNLQIRRRGQGKVKSFEELLLWCLRLAGGNRGYNCVSVVNHILESNVAILYLNTRPGLDDNTTNTGINVRRSYSSIAYNLADNINITASMRGKDLKGIVDKYNPKDESNAEFKLTINDTEYTIKPENNKAHILGKFGDSAKMKCEEINAFVKGDKAKIKDLHKTNYREKLKNNDNLTSDETLFMEILKFIDEMLNTNFHQNLDELETYLSISRNDLSGLFILASRVLAIANIYNKFNGNMKDADGTEKYGWNQLFQWLKDDELNQAYHMKLTFGDKIKHFFRDDVNFGWQLYAVTGQDKVLVNIAKARAAMLGNTSEATILDMENNRHPNYTLLLPGQDVQSLIRAIKKNNNDPRLNLFICDGTHGYAIDEAVVNSQCMLRDGTTISVKKMSEADLIYDSIHNKFITPIVTYTDREAGDKKIYIQPMTYADKTTLFTYGLNIDKLELSKFAEENFSKDIELKMATSAHNYYKKMWNNVLNVYNTLFSTNQLNDILNKLRSMTETLLTKLAQLKGVVVTRGIHYRILKDGKLSINEILYENANGYFCNASNQISNRFKNALDKQRLAFINKVLKLGVIFSSKMPEINEICKIFGINDKQYATDKSGWFINDLMIAAKVLNEKGDIVRYTLFDNITVNEGETLQLNPIYEKYFVLNTFLQNDMRLFLVGTELHHDIGDYNSIRNAMMKELQKNGYITQEEAKSMTIFDVRTKINKITAANPAAAQAMLLIYDKYIQQIVSSSLLAQSKRNITIPATIEPYLTTEINGIPGKLNIAVTVDQRANVFNFNGEEDKIKALDGSVIETAFMSRLENLSLQDDEVGDIKKPLLHAIDPTTGAAILLKCAVFAMTNYKMRQSINNRQNGTGGIDMYLLNKKMTDVKWHKSNNWNNWTDGIIDLVNGCAFRGSKTKSVDSKGNEILSGKIDFSQDILEGKSLYYQDSNYDASGNNYKKITLFGKEQDGNGWVYYTVELSGQNNVQSFDAKTRTKYYHYFDSQGHHIKVSEQEKKQNANKYKQVYNGGTLHTIDSLYELHETMGGIWSVSPDEDGWLQYSESSVNAVVNFMNLVARPIEGKNMCVATVDQEHYYLPLKHMMIHYHAFYTAVKDGAGNINPTKRLTDDEPLAYMTVSTKYNGKILDPDHAADLATMTEFSQVIAELDSGGQYHELVTELYQMLGRTALNVCGVELDAWQKYIGDKNDINALYDIIGRTILNNIDLAGTDMALTQALMEAVGKQFDLNEDHSLDEIWIPFSDPNLYSKIFSTFVSVINKKAIKRKYPGVGAVMVPSYNMSMVYELNGKIYQFEDLLTTALLEVTVSNDDVAKYPDTTSRNRFIVQTYLLHKLDEIIKQLKQDIKNGKITLDTVVEKFMPTDNVYVVMNMEDNTLKVLHLSLDSESFYYKFKDKYNSNEGVGGMRLVLQLYNLISKDDADNIQSFEYYQDVTRPRNLAPLKLQWSYTGTDGKTHYMCIFDHWRLKGLYNELKQIDSDVNLNEALKRQQRQTARIKWDPLKAMKEVENGEFYLNEENDKNKQSTKVTWMRNDAAELLLSNVYASKFGLTQEQSLAQVLEKGEEAFDINIEYDKFTGNFDVAFMKANGEHKFITFREPIGEHQRIVKWHVMPVEYKAAKDKEYINNNNVHAILYAHDKNNRRMFEVGREVYVQNITYDSNKKIFVDSLGSEVRGDYRAVDNGKRVVQRIYFIKHYRIYRGGKLYDTYYINRNSMKRLFPQVKVDTNDDTIKKLIESIQLTESLKLNNMKQEDVYYERLLQKDISNAVGRILAKIYNLNDFVGVYVNPTMTEQSFYSVKNSLSSFKNEVADYDIKDFIQTSIIDKMKDKPTIDDGTTDVSNKNVTIKEEDGVKNVTVKFNYDNDLFDLFEKLKKKIYTSFLKSQFFTSARIPAQALQSFMLMKCVGFTGTDSALAMVSHWQLWLLGSDYDIDKAYLMGLNFDDNGKYIQWSNLFDFSSLKALEASEMLPFGSRRVYKHNKNGLNVEAEIKAVVDAKNNLSHDDNEENHVALVNAYVALIRKLNSISTKTVDGEMAYYAVEYDNSNKDLQQVMDDIGKHEFYVIPFNQLEGALKNFISSRIQKIVQAPGNMIEAYTPVGMGDVTAAADLSPIGREIKQLSSYDPLSVFVLQSMNMVGKDGIAITAVSSKATNAIYWFQQQRINEASALESVNAEESKKMINETKFIFTTKRILNRSLGKDWNPKENTINYLPEINLSKATETIKIDVAGHSLSRTGKPSSASGRSQQMTMFTDNAKHLVAPRINCNLLFAPTYALLLSLGFDINDVVAFMTSPVVMLAGEFTIRKFFYNEDSFNIYDALDIIGGEYSKLVKKICKQYNIDSDMVISKTGNKYIWDLINAGNFEQVFKNINESDNNLFVGLKRLEMYFNKIKAAKNQYKDANGTIDENAFKEDIAELRNVYLIQEEYNNLGVILGINLGLKGDWSELNAYILRIQNMFQIRVSRMQDYESTRWNAIDSNTQNEINKVVNEGFDVYKFITNDKNYNGSEHQEGYADYIIGLYDLMKLIVNPYKIMKEHPLYHAMFTLFGMSMTIGTRFTIRSEIVNSILSKLHKRGIYSIPLAFMKRLISAADNPIIQTFLENNDISVPVMKGDPLLTLTCANDTASSNLLLKVNSLQSAASFKRFMDEKFIRMLRDGEYYYIDGEGNISKKTDDKLKSNKLLQNLLLNVTRKGVTYWALDFDISGIKTSPKYRQRALEYQFALNDLHKIKINEDSSLSLADLLFLYNLIIHKNRYDKFNFTRLFYDMSRNYESNSLIMRYFNYVSKLDRQGRVNDETALINININIDDILGNAARVISEDWISTSKDPAVITKDRESNLSLHIKTNNYSYSDGSPLLPVVHNESNSLMLDRRYNLALYFTLGGLNDISIKQNLKFIGKSEKSQLDNDDYNNVMEEINFFIRLGIIRSYDKICA